MSKHYSATTIAMKVLTIGIVQLFFHLLRATAMPSQNNLFFIVIFDRYGLKPGENVKLAD